MNWEGKKENLIRRNKDEKGCPLVSVIVPTYNRPDMLMGTIRSVLNQTYPHVEIIVVNDGSTDETEAVCLSYGGRIQYLRQSHQGIVQAINAGIERSHGDFFYFLSADDRLFPQTLEKQMSVMEKEEDCAVVCGNAKLINEHGEEIGDSMHPLPEKKADLLFCMLFRPTLHDGSLLWRRSALEAIGGLYFKPFENYNGYHHQCFQLAKHYRIRYVNEYLVYQRVHEDNMSHPKNMEKMIESYEIIRKKMRDYIQPWELFEGVNPTDEREMARAYFITAILFFYFGQYEIAYADLKKAVEIDPKIWGFKDLSPEISPSRYLYPLIPYEATCTDEALLAKAEKKKKQQVKDLLVCMNHGDLIKVFYFCHQALEKPPAGEDFLFLLAQVYLRQSQFYNSVNRFHKETRKLLEKILRDAPFHSIDLYLWLAFLDEEKRRDYLDALRRRLDVLKFFDLNGCLWLVKNAILAEKADLMEALPSIFHRKGLALNVEKPQEKGRLTNTKKGKGSGK